MIKLFYPQELFDSTDRGNWFELIKSKGRFERDGRGIDANIQKHIEWVSNRDIADIWILPMDWNFYYNKNKQKSALEFCHKAKLNNKKVLSHSGGDLGITIPVDSHVIVYRQSGYRSKLRSNEKCTPFFLSDPIGKFVDNEAELFRNNQSDKPIVGFCGMAPNGLITGVKERLQITFRNIKSFLGLSYVDYQQVMSTSNLRFRSLQVIDRSDYFNSNFIIRQKYRGGEKTEENRRQTTLEYYKNQEESDFIICVRGVGNFSVRFYESLAMGRVPIFIDTDCPLPEISTSWNDHLILVDSKEFNKIPEKVKDWLTRKDLKKIKEKNRKLWVDSFRLDNYWINELKLLS